MSAILQNLAQEIAAMKAKLHSLETAYNILSGSAAPSNGSAPQMALTGRKRAPAGYLEEQLVKVVTKEPQTNSALRDSLIKTGYPYSLNALHVSKALTRLTKAKKVKGTGTKQGRRYHLP